MSRDGAHCNTAGLSGKSYNKHSIGIVYVGGLDENGEPADTRTPDHNPALFTEVGIEEWPEWVRPTGAQDAYNKGDKVAYNGRHYVSLIDANVYSPDEYPAGWDAQP